MMRGLLLSLAFVVLCCVATDTGASESVVLQYEDFGPPSAAFEILGQPWWQWQSHGDSRPRKYDIKVVVYRNVELKDVQKTYPVDAEREQDYRYVAYAAALDYLDQLIAEDGVESVTATLKATREKIQRALESPAP
jgi:hypothetical protein